MQHVSDTCFVISTLFLIVVARKCWYESRWIVMHTISPPSTYYAPFSQGKWRKAAVTAYQIKTLKHKKEFIHCSWYHHHKQADFSLVCRKSEEDDKFTVNLALQEQGIYSFFCQDRRFYFWTGGFLPSFKLSFFVVVFLTIVAHTTKKCRRNPLCNASPTKFLHREVPCYSPSPNIHATDFVSSVLKSLVDTNTVVDF